MARYSINLNSADCPAETPVSVVDDRTGRIVSCEKDLVSAQKRKALLDKAGGEVPDDPDADKFACSDRAPIAFTTSPTAWW